MTEDEHGQGEGAERVSEALGETLHPLSGDDPRTDDSDLAPLGHRVADVDVVGLGEASHGTRECFRIKHRLFRHLVEEQGVRLLALEANFGATLAVNEYVLDGEGSAEAALTQSAIHASHQVESVRRLVEWIRSFNESRPREDRVRVHGVDVQHPESTAERLRAYLERVDPDALAAVADDLDALADGVPDVHDDEALAAHLDARASVVEALKSAFDGNEDEYVSASSRREYRVARRLVWALSKGREQFQTIADGRAKQGANVRVRDSAMAAQVQWLLRTEPVDNAVLWGHNAHLTRGDFGGGTVRHTQGIPSLGGNLARLSGLNYYAMGLLVGGGTVGAVHVPSGEFRRYDLPEPPAESVPDIFSRVEAPLFFLDVAGLPDDSPLATWLDSRPGQFDVVGGYRDTPVNLVASDLRRQFDGVVFVAESTSSEPLGDRA